MNFFKKKSIYLAVVLAIPAAIQTSLANAEASVASSEEALSEVSVSGSKIKAGTAHDSARTGSKTDAPLRDVPASVSVVPESLLREEGVLTMNEAMRNISSVQPQHGGGYGYANNYNSRGLSINFLRDDLPDGTAQNGYFRTMYDIDRIEVLKGPGSALFGSGGPGGSINVVTKKPQAKYNLEVGGTFGSFDTKNGYIDLTGTITNGVTGRLIADTEHTDGFRGLSRDISEFSPSILWAYDTDKSLLVDVDVRRINVKPDNYGIVFNRKGDVASVSEKTRYYSPMNYSEQNISRVGLTHDWAISDALSMRTAFNYDMRDLDFIRNAGGNGGNAAGVITGRNLREQHDEARYTTLQNELTWKADTGSIKHTVLAGYEYRNTSNDTLRIGYTLPNIANINNPVVRETSVTGLARIAAQGFDRKLTSDTHSVYLQDQIALNEQFKVRAGLRNDHIHYQDKGLQGTLGFRKIEETKDLTTGSLGAVYQPTQSLAFYTGYSNGKFVNLATESTAVATTPETSEQYEIGTKSSFFGDKLNLNLAYFDVKRENYNITLPGASAATPDGKDASKGVELDISASPLAGWNINANAVWMDAVTKSRSVANNPAMGVTVNRSIYGTRPTAVSEEIFSLWNSYTVQSGVAQGFTFGIGATHKGDAYADNLNLYKVPAYTVYDAAISYKQPKWEAALNFKNITDKEYYVSPTFVGALPGDPRSAYLTVRFDFN